MTAPTITTAPPAPLRSEDSATFSEKAEAFVAWQEGLPDEMNTATAFVETKAGEVAADAVATAADRVATGNDATATAADALATGADADATAADRVQTGLDRIATGADAVATDADATATAADRVQTGLDRTAAAASATSAGTSETNATAALASIEAAIGDQFDNVAGDIYDPSGRLVRFFIGPVDGTDLSSCFYIIQVGTALRAVLYSPIIEGDAADLVRTGEVGWDDPAAASPRRVAFSGLTVAGTRYELLAFETDGTIAGKPGWRFNRAAEEAPTVLSGTVGNAFEVKRLGDGIRAFYSDLGTKTARYRQKVSGTAVVFDAAYFVITGWIGQSLAAGTSTGSPITTTAPAGNHAFMLSGAVKAYGGGRSTDITAAKSAGTTDDEPPAYGFAAQRHTRQVARASRLDVLGVCVGGVSNAAYAALAKGTANYITHAAALRRFMEIVVEYGMTPKLELRLTHGEADRSAGTSRATYLANLGTWRTDYQTDWRAWTGDAGAVVPMYLDQLSGQSTTNGPGLIGMAQLDYVEANPTVAYAVCPKYFLPQAVDGIHLTAVGSRILGEYHGRANDVVAGSGTWNGLRPNGNPTRSGAVITQPMLIQTSPMVFDTSTMPDRGSKGFEATKVSDGTALTISSVAISTSNIVVTLSADPGEPVRLRYAYTARSGGDPTNPFGPCAWGNLRDSDSTAATYDGRALYNWCWAFEKDTTT